MQEIKIEKIEPLFSPESLAEYFGVDYKTINKLRRRGRLPVADLLIGKRKLPRWKPETIQAVIDSGVL